jgi:hypothetical protein
MPAIPVIDAADISVDIEAHNVKVDNAWVAERAIVATVAPLLGLALDGPLSSLAFNTVRSALGLDARATATEVALVLRDATLEHLHALQQANGKFRVQMKSLRITNRQLGGEPADAPRRPLDGPYLTTRFPACFALMISTLFFLLLTNFAWHPIPVGGNEAVLNVMLGAVATSFTTVVGYWFGSTNTSGRKDIMLYNSRPTPTAQKWPDPP